MYRLFFCIVLQENFYRKQLYYFLIKFFNQKGPAFGVTDSVILTKSRNLVS